MHCTLIIYQYESPFNESGYICKKIEDGITVTYIGSMGQKGITERR